MKSVVISIQPKWVEKILNGEKTIEIRKTKPREEVEWVYIYCTISKYDDNLIRQPYNPHYYTGATKKELIHSANTVLLNGKIVARFRLKKVEDIGLGYYSLAGYKISGERLDQKMSQKEALKKAKVSLEEFCEYSKGAYIYAWQIDNLEIFDEPKELSEFGLKKAPQSWGYIK